MPNQAHLTNYAINKDAEDFKITDQDGGNPFYVWGQDRMWLLKEEIFKRLGGSL